MYTHCTSLPCELWVQLGVRLVTWPRLFITIPKQSQQHLRTSSGRKHHVSIALECRTMMIALSAAVDLIIAPRSWEASQTAWRLVSSASLPAPPLTSNYLQCALCSTLSISGCITIIYKRRFAQWQTGWCQSFILGHQVGVLINMYTWKQVFRYNDVHAYHSVAPRLYVRAGGRTRSCALLTRIVNVTEGQPAAHASRQSPARFRSEHINRQPSL